jgi:tetratricopeptide (TPR) repeat protein
VALVAVVGAALLLAAVSIDDPGGRITRQWDEFTQLRTTADQQTRFLSGGGNRYDYWRIAVDEFQDEPLHGVGAGSYQFGYYQERRTQEDIRQPHSIELQALSELGVVGLALVLALMGAVLYGFGRRAMAARRDAAQAGLLVAAGGVFMVWLVHTSVDWIHLIPGVTGAALAAAAVLLGPWRGAATLGRSMRHKLVVAGCALLVAGAAVFLARATLADRHAAEAKQAVPADPRKAIEQSARALALNSDSVSTWYTRAAAYARLGDYQRARGSLVEAIRIEPDNFVTWALIGDLAVRHGDSAQARGYYRRALALNPRDEQLRTLVANPPTPPAP